MRNSFSLVAANIKNPKWDNIVSRVSPLYSRNNDIRSDFERDYTRIVHSNAYRRLKHKTQVFFSPQNDHICTRIEHVNHVESISYTIAHYLGLNVELTKAISASHDLGHGPFGHRGEAILSEISKHDLGSSFWHEKNGLFFVDNLELLEDNEGYKQNLNLTYGVRDGIISHCGEIDENSVCPRNEFIDLGTYSYPNQFAPYTWEGCVVKISDKISYIGRDIEDAISLGILDEHLQELYELLHMLPNENIRINNTVIINNLIYDLCENSSPEKGLCFSEDTLNLMNKIKKFNYDHIYSCDRVRPSERYFSIVLNEIYNVLKSTYSASSTLKNLQSIRKFYPTLVDSFCNWIQTYWNIGNRDRLKNKVLFDVNCPNDFYFAIICYISGMTDKFAIDIYNEIIGF